jgi:hypothetical protein
MNPETHGTATLRPESKGISGIEEPTAGSRYEWARLPESANARRAFGDFAQLRKANS